MLERFKKDNRRPGSRRRSGPDDGGLPFDLELTRRVTGEYMPARWGTGDPVGESLPYGTGRQDLQRMAQDVSEWESLPRVPFGTGAATALHAQMQIADNDKRIIRVIDDLRTQLLQTLQAELWTRIAITAPTYGCGATFSAVQLALSLSRIPDCRTILMDLNQRRPGVAPALGLRAPGDIRAFLGGRVGAEDHLQRLSDTLAVGLTDARAANASEVLHSKRTAARLDAMTDALRPDVVLYDLPPMLEHDDLEAFLPQVEGVLIVADAGQTLASQIAECERRLAGKTNLLGVILNRTRPAWPAANAA